MTLDPGPIQTLADRFDFRFVIDANPEPSCNADLYFVTIIETFDGDDMGVTDSFTAEDPYGHVEAAREAQQYTLEERFDMYAARGW